MLSQRFAGQPIACLSQANPAPALGLRALGDGVLIQLQANSLVEVSAMSRASHIAKQRCKQRRTVLTVERLEDRTVPDGNFGPWSAPINLGPVVNPAFNDQHPAISPDGLSLYITSNRPGG